MANSYLDGFLNGSTTIDEIRQQTYEKYKDKFKDSTEDLVNSDTFLNLLVAEMTNQDPLEPTSNTEFITQLASFSQLNYMRDSSRYAQANYAASLVGKIATATKPNGKDQVTKTGIVESVSKKGDSYNVVIDGEMFDISKVTKVEDPGTSGTNTVNAENALADRIASASSLILKYVTVKTDDGIAAGFIDKIKVNDGKITAVVVDEDGKEVGEYPVEKLTEITEAYIGVDMPNEPADGTNKPEQSDDENKKVDETVGANGTDDVGT